MGVVAYRAGDWKTAAETLKKSNRINGGTGIDCFFLAMTYWQQGDQEEARQWFDHGLAWVENSQSKDPEVRQFHAEAAALLGLPGPGPQPGPGASRKADAAEKSGGKSG